jgi:hypothetical protein
MHQLTYLDVHYDFLIILMVVCYLEPESISGQPNPILCSVLALAVFSEPILPLSFQVAKENKSTLLQGCKSLVPLPVAGVRKFQHTMTVT